MNKPEVSKLRKSRLYNLLLWLLLNQPLAVGRMIWSDEEFKKKFPTRYKNRVKWDKHWDFYTKMSTKTIGGSYE